MKNLKSYILGIINLVLILVLGFLFFSQGEQKNESGKSKIVFIDNVKLFESYNYRNELLKDFEVETNTKKLMLDSLNYRFQVLGESLKDQSNPAKKDLLDYNTLRRQATEENQRFENWQYQRSNEYTGMVWDRLNLAIEDFGKENGYHVILGAQAKGNVMYGDSLVDVTSEVIVFANNKYEGE